MKIAQITATFPPYMAGTGNVSYHYALELAKLGNEVTIFTSRYPDEDYEYSNLIEVKRFKPLFKVGNAPFILQLFKVRDYDIIHLHYPFFFGGEIIYLISKLFGKKYIITYHNDTISGGLKNYLFSIHRQTLSRKILMGAEKIIVLSEDYTLHSNLKNVFNKKKQDIVVLPNGVDLIKFNPSVKIDNLKSEHKICDTDNILLFVGALDMAHTFKGLEFLLKAFQKILLTNTDTTLIVVGDGDIKNYYINMARELGVLHKIIFTGKVTDSNLPKYYSAADIFVLPSTAVENFPLVLLEAMASGKPVVVSRLPGVRTMVDDEVNGFLVEPENINELAEKIIDLLGNEYIRIKFGAEIRKQAEEKFSWDRIVQKLEKIYVDVVQ